MKENIEKYMTAEMAGVTLVLAMGIYALINLYVIPNIYGELSAYQIFDKRNMGYDLNDAQNIIRNLSTNGLNIYKRVYLPLDFIFSLLFAIFGYQTYYIYSRWISVHKIALYIPGLIILFDLFENIVIELMLHNIISSRIVLITSSFTIAKNTMMLAFVLAICVLSLFTLITKSVEKIS